MIASRANSCAALLIASWLTACGGGEDRPAPAVASGGSSTTGEGGASSTSAGGQSATAGESQAGEQSAGAGAATGGEGSEARGGQSNAGGASSAQAGAGGVGGDPGVAEPMFPCATDDATTPPAFDAECALDVVLGDAARVPVDAGELAHLIAVTSDELSLVWSSYGSSAITYFVADRASTSDPFDPPRQLNVVGSVVGLSSDGLRLVTLDPEHKAYAESTRAARGEDFGEATRGPFVAINDDADASGLTLESGVLSADARTFVYSALGSGGYPMRASSRKNGDDAFTVGAPLSQCELAAHDALVRIPTGLSSDGLTLFFFDPDRNAARAAWRSAESAPFTWFRDLPRTRVVVPGSGCKGLYFSQRGDGPLMRTAVQ